MKIVKLFNCVVFVIYFAVLNGSDCKHEESNEFIVWKEGKKIEWSDFKAEFPSIDGSADEVSINLKLYYEYDGILKYDVVCYMDKGKSWAFEKSDYALNHEQGHFDIGEIYARKLRKAVQKYVPVIKYSTIKKLDSLEVMYHSLLVAEEERYDEETTHPTRNSIKQRYWDIKIKNALDSLNGYKRNPGHKLKQVKYL